MTIGFLIGLDAGTSVTKAGLFDGEGRQIATAIRRTQLRRPHAGWCELDPEEAWHATAAVLREVHEKSDVPPSAVRGIGLSGAMVGAWVLDGDGHPLRPGIVWEDCRSQSIIDAMMTREPSVMSQIFSSSGSVLQQGCTLPVMAWLVDNERALMQRARHVVSYKDYLRHRLTGVIATDRSEAAVIPGDARTRSRSDAMINLFGLRDWAGLLPPVRDAETIAGGLSADAAQQLGLPVGLPVTIGSGDVASTLIGSGCLAPGSAMGVLGTGCTVGVCHDRPVFTPPDLGLLFSLPGDVWYRGMMNVAGTLNLDWAIDLVAPDQAGLEDRFETATALAETALAGAGGVTFLPYLSESGIIAPVVDATARAQLSGLSPASGQAQVLRAVYEGVAFAIHDLVDLLDFGGRQIVFTGGGSKSPFWMQMIADVLERDVLVRSGSEFGARGAALILATALGDYADIRTASHAVAGDGVLYSSRGADAYRDAMARFRSLRDALLSLPRERRSRQDATDSTF